MTDSLEQYAIDLERARLSGLPDSTFITQSGIEVEVVAPEAAGGEEFFQPEEDKFSNLIDDLASFGEGFMQVHESGQVPKEFLNEIYAASIQGVSPHIAANKEPVGFFTGGTFTESGDDEVTLVADQSIVKADQWMTDNHVVLFDADGNIAVYDRDPQYEEAGVLGIGRMLRDLAAPMLAVPAKIAASLLSRFSMAGVADVGLGAGPKAVASMPTLSSGGAGPPRPSQVDMRINQMAFDNDARSLAQKEGISIEEATRQMEESEAGGVIGGEPTRAALRGRELEDLETSIPVETRTATPPTPGQKTNVRGESFLDGEDLERVGSGVNFEQPDLDRIWNESVQETGPVADNVLSELRADGKDMKPKDIGFWDSALRLKDRARYWYEISAEAFKDLFPDFTNEELVTFIDLVAATSPQADPHMNIRRAVGVMSQFLRGHPIDVDITSKTAVGSALQASKLEGLKTGSFANTFDYHLGLDDMPPLSTNDRQVASSFGVSGEDIANNDVVYEVLSRFYIKMRDMLNQGVGADSNLYETWQVQALGWVQERLSKGKLTNDDYLQALEGVKDDLVAAGIELPDGKLTREVLMDPRVEKVMSSTLEKFRESPIATIETVTAQTTAEGAEAARIVSHAQATGNTVAVKEYDKIVKRSLNALIGRHGGPGAQSVADDVVEAALGKKPHLARMEIGQGTFEGAIASNARIPLPPDMTEIGQRAVLAIMGRGLRQAAAPASLFKFVEEADVVAENWVKTYSVFVQDVEGVVSADVLRNMAPSGHDINIKKVANGHVIDINPRFLDDDSKVGPILDEVVDALVSALPGTSLTKKDLSIRPRHYYSEYLTTADYNKAISDLRREILDVRAKKLAGEFTTSEARARRLIKGTADVQGIRDSGRRRIEAARDRYQRRIGDIPGKDKTAREAVIADETKKLAKALDGDALIEARQALKGQADLSRHSAGRKGRIDNARKSYLEHINKISKADRTTKSVATGHHADVVKYNERFKSLGQGGG